MYVRINWFEKKGRKEETLEESLGHTRAKELSTLSTTLAKQVWLGEDWGMNRGKVLGRYQNGKWIPVRQIKGN